MSDPVAILAFDGFPKSQRFIPSFCKKHRLTHRFSIELDRKVQDVDFVLGFVRRILKLFPFEWMKIEVPRGRSKDLFEDWDSYLEWLRADEPSVDRWFSTIQVMRRNKVLGYLIWEKQAEGRESLAIYTEAHQADPFTNLCESIGNSVQPPRKLIVEKGNQRLKSKKWGFFFKS